VSQVLQCPVCRARVEQGPQCRRCRADLQLLFTLSEQRQHALGEAYRQAAQGRWQRALALAQGVEALQDGDDVRHLLAVACLLRRDFAGAWQWYSAFSSLYPEAGEREGRN